MDNIKFPILQITMNDENIINNKDVLQKDIDKFSNVVEALTTSSVSRKTNQRHSIDKNTLEERIRCNSKNATCYKLRVRQFQNIQIIFINLSILFLTINSCQLYIL